MSEAEAAAFRADLGLAEATLERVIRLSHRLLGLFVFFTAGQTSPGVDHHDGDTAWRRPRRSTRPGARLHPGRGRGLAGPPGAGGSTAEARRPAAALGGPHLPNRDGDVIEVLFNVAR